MGMPDRFRVQWRLYTAERTTRAANAALSQISSPIYSPNVTKENQEAASIVYVTNVEVAS